VWGVFLCNWRGPEPKGILTAVIVCTTRTTIFEAAGGKEGGGERGDQVFRMIFKIWVPHALQLGKGGGSKKLLPSPKFSNRAWQ